MLIKYLGGSKRMRRIVSSLRGATNGRLGVLRRGLWIAALCAAAGAIAVVVVPASGASTSNPGTALLDEQSVTTSDGIEKEGHPISLEQYAAEQAGYTVTVVSAAEWEGMTSAQFAQYQLLIVGDPDCGDTAVSAIASAEKWAPVVMGTSGINPLVGNRVVVGTDPEYHYAAGAGGAQPTNPAEPTTGGAEHLEQDGITYAGGVSGATGVYFDTSCGDPNPTPEGEAPVAGGDLTVLEQLTASGAGQWTENAEDVPCGTEVKQIAENPSFDSGATKLTDANIEGWSCSDHIAFPHFPVEWNAVAAAQLTPAPTCGIDPESKEEVCGEAYVLVAGKGIVASAPNLVLTPASESNPAGGTHTVTATVSKAGVPISGTVVNFLVTETNVGVTGICTTSTGAEDPTCASDETGVVKFTYSDAKGVGTDTINASITLNGVNEHATATEEWTAAPVATTSTTTTTTAASETLAFKAAGPPACASKRDFKIHIQNVKQLGIVSAVVSIDGKDDRTLRGKRLTTAIDLVGLPKGTFTVEIVATRRDGRTAKGERVYHTCVSKLPGRSYLPLIAVGGRNK
jgi:hypothetical protein